MTLSFKTYPSRVYKLQRCKNLMSVLNVSTEGYGKVPPPPKKKAFAYTLYMYFERKCMIFICNDTTYKNV